MVECPRMKRLDGILEISKNCWKLEKETPSLELHVAVDNTGSFHGNVTPHHSLGDGTPIALAGLEGEGENKWLALIQNAAKKSNNIGST